MEDQFFEPVRNRHGLISCECGAEFRVIPDLEEMMRTIESHAREHQKRETDQRRAVATFVRIQDLLIRQVQK